MNGRVSKKVRQFARKKIDAEWHLLAKMLRPKPKWVPAFVWHLFYKIVFREEINYEEDFPVDLDDFVH